MKTTIRLFNAAVIVAAAAWLSATAFGQTAQQPKITITAGPSYDVLGPDHATSINVYGHMGLADEHSTILPPGTLPFQSDYLFFVATHTQLAPDTGLVVMRNTSPPDANGQWSLDFSPSYGLYQPNGQQGARNGQVFTTAMAHSNCPGATRDATFDLNYAAPGSVFVDPTNPWDRGFASLLMVYEGTNRCVRITTNSNLNNHFYSTLGIATSGDLGHTWPTYRANFTALPAVNQSQGPNAASGAWGNSVCWGNFCSSINLLQPPSQFGRYPVSGPVTTVAEAETQASGGLAANMGDSEPSAFVDDVRTASPLFVYLPHTYNPGKFPSDSPLPQGVGFDIAISRIALNGGTARLQATHWYEGQFSEPGLGENGGGHESPIFSNLATTLDKYQHCLTPDQSRSAASISYSDAAKAYVLTFVCVSPTEPATATAYRTGAPTGGAWFYSTIDANLYDLSRQDQWSTPNQIGNSWSPFASGGSCQDFDGWYPSLMSIGAKPGHLAADGYFFYTKGCTSGGPGRRYSSRSFTIQPN